MHTAALAGAAVLAPVHLLAQEQEKEEDPFKGPDPVTIKTNISAAQAVPKTGISMPGPYPGVVSEVFHSGAVANGQADAGIAAAMLAAGMKSLTGARDERDAWSELFSPNDYIGIKVNPVGGKIAGVTHELTNAVIASLESIGVPRSKIIFWDHYKDDLFRMGFNPDNYPGIEFHCHHYFVTEGEKKIGKGEEFLDKNVFYEADFTIPDEQNELNYMLTGGSKSYYPKILTQGVDKIINIPVLKHHVASFTTGAFKNLAYGATNNCVRGHFFIDRYNTEVCAFPPIRDKTVLNIMDALRGQYAGGPATNAGYVWYYNSVLVATDPVALDSTGFDILLEKQLEKELITREKAQEIIKKYDFLARAENLGLGIYKSRPIDHRKLALG